LTRSRNDSLRRFAPCERSAVLSGDWEAVPMKTPNGKIRQICNYEIMYRRSDECEEKCGKFVIMKSDTKQVTNVSSIIQEIMPDLITLHLTNHVN
jgi:hypothetical protein